MALPYDITDESPTAVVADADSGAMGAVPLLMPRYSLAYDIGLGGVGVDAFAPSLTRRQIAETRRRWRGEEPTGRFRTVWNRGATALGAYGTFLGDADADQAELTRLQASLHQLALAITLARNSGQSEAEQQLRAQFAATKRVVDGLVARLRRQEGPGALATAVAGVGDFVRGLGGKVALVAAVGLGLFIVAPMLAARGRAAYREAGRR